MTSCCAGAEAEKIKPTLHPKRAKELQDAGSVIFGKVNDALREAVPMAIGRKLNPEVILESTGAGINEIFAKE